MAIISYQHKFLYLPQPRTASKSITKVLLRDYGARQIGNYHKIPKSMRSKYREFAEFFVFTSIRSPRTRLRSAWARDPKWSQQTFTEWLHWLAEMDLLDRPSVTYPLVNRLSTWKGIIHQFIRYEDLRAGLDRLPFVDGPFPSLPERPWRTPHPPLTSEEEDLIWEIGHNDFEAFYGQLRESQGSTRGHMGDRLGARP